jgi:hypothetical protein
LRSFINGKVDEIGDRYETCDLSAGSLINNILTSLCNIPTIGFNRVFDKIDRRQYLLATREPSILAAASRQSARANRWVREFFYKLSYFRFASSEESGLADNSKNSGNSLGTASAN